MFDLAEMVDLSAFNRLKLQAARVMARALQLRQIHIVGCARSGTNMAHFAMLGFEGIIVGDQESNPDYPGVGDLVRMYRRGDIGGRPVVLVTKRGFRWSEPEHLARLIRRVQSEELGLIYLVRDPRDVLLSIHSAVGPDSSYVSVQRWHASMLAGERLLAAVQSLPRTLILRYEDFVHDPLQVQGRIAETFSLRLRHGVENISDIRRSIELANVNVAPNRVRSMHSIRPIDAASVGKWRRTGRPDSLLESYPELRGDFEQLIMRYRYDSTVST